MPALKQIGSIKKAAILLAGATTIGFVSMLPWIAAINGANDAKREERTSRWVRNQVAVVERIRREAEIRVRVYELEQADKKKMDSTTAREFEEKEDCGLVVYK